MSRSLLNHGSGKGDKPRTKLDANYRQRMEEIKFDGRSLIESGFVFRRGRWVKKYT